MKRTMVLCAAMIAAMPHCKAMDGKLSQEESNWLSKVHTAYTTKSSQEAIKEANSNIQFIRSAHISLFHHLIRVMGMVPQFDVLAHLIRQNASIPLDVPGETIAAEQRLWQAACIQQEKLLTCKDQASIAPISKDLCTIVTTLLCVQKKRLKKQAKRADELFYSKDTSAAPASTASQLINTTHEQDGTYNERSCQQTPTQLPLGHGYYPMGKIVEENMRTTQWTKSPTEIR